MSASLTLNPSRHTHTHTRAHIYQSPAKKCEVSIGPLARKRLLYSNCNSATVLEASQEKPGCFMMMRLREDPVVVQAFVRNTPVEKLQLHTGRSWACNYSSGTGQKGAPSTFFNHPRRGTFQTAAAAKGLRYCSGGYVAKS